MASKLSAALLIPCVAVVFAVAFFRDLGRWKRYVGQFAAFLAVSVPPAVAWPVYHLISFQLPLNYVRLPAETIYVGHLSLWQRLESGWMPSTLLFIRAFGGRITSCGCRRSKPLFLIGYPCLKPERRCGKCVYFPMALFGRAARHGNRAAASLAV